MRPPPFPKAKALIRFLTLLLAGLLVLGAWAQTPEPSATPTAQETPGPTPTSEPLKSEGELQNKLAEIEKRLQEVPPNEGTLLLESPGEPPASVTSLRKMEASLRRLITLREQLDKLKKDQVEVQAEIHQVTQGVLNVEKPYTVATLDKLQTELTLANERTSSAEMTVKAARTSLNSEQASLSEFEALRRRLLDRVERAKKNNKVSLDLERQLDDATAAVESSRVAVQLAQAEVDYGDAVIELGARRKELLELKLEALERRVRFTRDTLRDQVAQLEQARMDLSDKLSSVRDAINASSAKLQALHDDDIPDTEQDREIAAREAWVKTHQRKRTLTEKVLELNLARRELWERRFLISQGQAGPHASQWSDAAQGLEVRLDNNRETLSNELSELRIHLSALLSAGEDAESLDRWTSVQAQALVARQAVIEETLLEYNDTLSLARRLLAELSIKKGSTTVAQRGRQVLSAAVDFWNIELYTMGDRSVTVGKLFVAVMILLAGLTLVGRFSHFLGTRFLTRLPVEDSVKYNLERALYYFLVLMVFLFALHVVNIPLTIFTFLGGTLAIAVGFGAQNILNNFISGLILMMEKPIRVGDLIEVESTIGFVEKIGGRSTRVRIPTGIHVVLPNSVLLENRVINWTLTDQKIRTKVSVGVAYGTSSRKVIDLLTEVTRDVPSVNNTPLPVVIFDDFGDSSLNFTVHFWVTIKNPLDKLRVETEVRVHIEEALAEHDITIPFPQRDLNFNHPVPVKIVQEDENSNAEKDN